ncbi:MAG: beta-lactamase family protein [Bacteroidia bacterium]|nr:beta-lactamase family protein [Bacteroidia bacterium]
MRNKPTKCSLKLFLILLVVAPVFFKAQNEYTFLIEQYLRSKDKISEINGVVLVAKNNQIIYQKALGFANHELKIPNNIGTHFKIGAIGTNFTSAAILQLQHRGLIGLNDTADKFFPDLKHKTTAGQYLLGNPIRVHHLLMGASGLKDVWEFDKQLQNELDTINKDTLIRKIGKLKPNNFPGNAVEYSNTTYYVLGQIAERVSGQTFEEYVTSAIFKIAGMNESGFVNEKIPVANMAVNYEFNQNGYKPARKLPYNYFRCSNGIYATANDLFKWHLSFYDTMVLDNLSNRLMHTAYNGFNGYGLLISKAKDMVRYELGLQRDGISTCMSQFPKEGICIIVLLNDFKDARSICEVLENIVNNKPVILPYPHKEIKMSEKKLKNFEGIYTTFPDMKYFSFRLKVYNNKLYRLDRESVELKPESDTKFFYANGKDRQLEFMMDKDGKFIKGWQIRNGIKEEFMEFKKNQTK